MDDVVAIEQVSARPKRAEKSLYKPRQAIHPKAVSGRYRRLKWALTAVLLAIYWGVPWLRWDRGPNFPDQAALIDLPGRRFYFFMIEIWPQEIYYLTGLLVLAAIGLFLVTAIAGRVWCGYACPQTVWTDLFIAVESWIEGDRNARLKLDKAPWTLDKIARRGAKHALWIAIGVATGGAWVFYFADAPTLTAQLLSLSAPAPAYITIALLAGTTYLFAGFAREQVCTYMCPYARFQAAMFDEETLIVTYDRRRGEPRAKHKQGDGWQGRGDCIACNQCVAVCPAGIDIRDGQQLECITCALCIDACNAVMDKVGRPRGLIRYDTVANLDRRARGLAARFNLMRPRTLAYGAIVVAVSGLMLTGLITRGTLDVNVLHDRNPFYVRLSDGSIRNGYTVKIINKSHEQRRYRVLVEGLGDARTTLLGGAAADADAIEVAVASDRLGSFRVFVRAPQSVPREEGPRDQTEETERTPIDFVVTDLADGGQVRNRSMFVRPES